MDPESGAPPIQAERKRDAVREMLPWWSAAAVFLLVLFVGLLTAIPSSEDAAWAQFRAQVETYKESVLLDEAQRTPFPDVEPGVYWHEGMFGTRQVRQMLRFGGRPAKEAVPFVYELHVGTGQVKVTGSALQKGRVLILRPDKATPYLTPDDRSLLISVSADYFDLGHAADAGAAPSRWVRQGAVK